MMIATAKKNSLPLALVSAVAILALNACGQPAPEVVEAPVAEAPAEATGVADDGRLVSIDADGNIAPFGMASKQPVEVPELAAAPQKEMVAVSNIYTANCSACHGPDAAGVQGLGLNLRESELVGNSSAEELIVFLQAGRQPNSPDSVTGIPMPAFAWMDAADLAEVAGYIKGLQQ